MDIFDALFIVAVAQIASTGGNWGSWLYGGTYLTVQTILVVLLILSKWLE